MPKLNLLCCVSLYAIRGRQETLTVAQDNPCACSPSRIQVAECRRHPPTFNCTNPLVDRCFLSRMRKVLSEPLLSLRQNGYGQHIFMGDGQTSRNGPFQNMFIYFSCLSPFVLENVPHHRYESFVTNRQHVLTLVFVGCR